MNNITTSTPQIDVSFTITAVIALIALISPILTTLINNFHDTKMKKIEIKENNIKDNLLYKRTIIHQYLAAVGKCIGYYDANAVREYGEYFPKAYTLINDQTIKEQMIVINNVIRSKNRETTNEELEKLLPMIEKEIYCE